MNDSVPDGGILIGESREGRSIRAWKLGHGKRLVSLVAGAHADEPTGPRLLREWIAELQQPSNTARDLLDRFTFLIVPDVNPDGAARNARWVREVPSLAEYLVHAVREKPGDDIEFNYPRDDSDRGTRPENLALADWLREAVAKHGSPLALHASLHGMGIAEGAWFLVCREWAERTVKCGMAERLAAMAMRENIGLHDIDRGGEKGFARFARGFSTTPRSDAMRAFFLEQNDNATAALFRPSSMEFAQSLGGDPLCLVSEMPLWVITRRGAKPGDAYADAREDLAKLRSQETSSEQLREVETRHGLRWLDWQTQMRFQRAFVMEGLCAVSEDEAD